MKLITSLVFMVCCWSASYCARTVFDEIGSNPELSQFRAIVNMDLVLPTILQHRAVTVFVPTNDAFAKHDRYKAIPQAKLANYHTLTTLLRKELFPYNVNTLLAGAAPLYLNYIRPHLNSHDPNRRDYFVNNAKIISEKTFTTSNGEEKQLLYIIDEVLEPYIPATPLPPLALQLIRDPSIYGIQRNFNPFYQRVSSTRQESLFDKPGNHTFFIPVGDITSSREAFDEYVVRSHIIPDNARFVRSMGNDFYNSAAFDGNVNVTLSLINRTNRMNVELSYYVQSNTLASRDPQRKHHKGVVMSRILLANIPVKNGVIHLIERPLMVIESSVSDFLDNERDGRLSIFNRLLTYVPEVRSLIESQAYKTVLAFTDTAFNNLKESESDDKEQWLIQRQDELRQLMSLHVVPQSVSTDDIRSDERYSASKQVSASDGRELYFRVVGGEKSPIVTVEGGGVNATAVQADIGATNGIIHIIDRVLGMPFQNIYDKLKSDPDLNFTYFLGEQSNWNNYAELQSDKRRYTYFVPSQRAWDAFRRENPSEYKQLELNMYPALTRKILDRHLVVRKQLSSAQLEVSDEIHTREGILKVGKSLPGSNLYIHWEDVVAKIVRPDVQAINGVIHVIDGVLIKRRDLSINSSMTTLSSVHLLIVALAIAMIRAKLY